MVVGVLLKNYYKKVGDAFHDSHTTTRRAVSQVLVRSECGNRRESSDTSRRGAVMSTPALAVSDAGRGITRSTTCRWANDPS